MPEITEVEKLRLQLELCWTGRTIVKFTAPSSYPNSKKFAVNGWDRFSRFVRAGPLIKFDRLGKNIWIRLSTEGLAWHIHLGSTGWFIPGNKQAVWLSRYTPLMDPAEFIHSVNEKGRRLSIVFDDGQRWDYIDPRTWGKWYLRQGNEIRDNEYFKGFGPDWLYESYDATKVLLAYKSQRNMKAVLCDQSITAGLGNYMACEIAWHAGIHPHSSWNEIEREKRRYLMRQILAFVDVCMANNNHDHWKIFKKKDEECEKCRGQIKYLKDKGGSRGSYFCELCQPKYY